MNNYLPRFSVITVTRNAENDIARTLVSVKNQSCKKFELILIDGASIDNTLSVVNSLNISGIKIISEQDEGIYDAMNKGLGLASGEYVYFLNAGDYFASETVLEDVSKFMIALKEPDIFYGDVIGYIDDNERYLRQPGEINKEVLVKRTICHQAIFSKRSLFLECGNFDSRYDIAADYVWLADLFIEYNKRFSYKSYPICYYSLAGISSSNGYFLQRYRVLRKYFGLQYIVAHRYLPWLRKKSSKLCKKLLKK